MNKTATIGVNTFDPEQASASAPQESAAAAAESSPGACLRRAQGGDSEAFAALFEVHRPLLYRIAQRIVGPDDADDVVMDTYLKAWRALPAFRGTASLRTWLCRAVRNTALDHLRWRARRPAQTMVQEESQGAVGIDAVADGRQPAPDRQAQLSELGQVLAVAVHELSEEHRLTLLLREVDGLSYREVAAATGVNLGTVMSRLFYARRRLRHTLEAQGVTP